MQAALTQFLPLLLLGPVLVATGYFDLRHMRIPNALSLIALALFALSALVFLSPEEVLLRAGLAAAVLVAGFLLFLLGYLGGGDVKIFAALFLFVPSGTVSVFMLVFSAAMLFGMALMPVLRAIPGAAATGWASLRSDANFPMGISIALAGLAHPVVMSALYAAG